MPVVHDEEFLKANPLPPALGPELAHWAAEAKERIRELRKEAEALESDVEGAFAAARILLSK